MTYIYYVLWWISSIENSRYSFREQVGNLKGKFSKIVSITRDKNNPKCIVMMSMNLLYSPACVESGNHTIMHSKYGHLVIFIVVLLINLRMIQVYSYASLMNYFLVCPSGVF